MAINIRKQIYRKPDFLVFDGAALDTIRFPVNCKDGGIGKKCDDGQAGVTCVAHTGATCRGTGGVGVACSGESYSVVCLVTNHPISCRSSTGASNTKEAI